MLTDWNTAAATTIVANGGKSPGASAVWFSYSSLAVYDAVNAITGQYAHFYYHFAGRPDASIDAAAARRVLTNFFPSQKATLDSQLSASLAGITGGVASVAAGVRGWGGRCRHRR
jgi:hypothetical protein